MKFLLDESADARFARYLVEHGHDVATVITDYPLSLPDKELLALAHAQGRVLITNDRDFGELVFRDRSPHSGVILFRLTTTAYAAKLVRLATILADYADRLNQFLVVTDNRIRVRQRP